MKHPFRCRVILLVVLLLCAPTTGTMYNVLATALVSSLCVCACSSELLYFKSGLFSLVLSRRVQGRFQKQEDPLILRQ